MIQCFIIAALSADGYIAREFVSAIDRLDR